jgi:hypothetical protein
MSWPLSELPDGISGCAEPGEIRDPALFSTVMGVFLRGQCGAVDMRGIDAGRIPGSFTEVEFNARCM